MIIISVIAAAVRRTTAYQLSFLQPLGCVSLSRLSRVENIMNESNAHDSSNGFANEPLFVEDQDSQHNHSREHSGSPLRRILPLKGAIVRQKPPDQPSSDDFLRPSPENSIDSSTTSGKTSISQPSKDERPEAVGLSGSLTEEVLYSESTASAQSAPSIETSRADNTKAGLYKTPTPPTSTPKPTRKNSRTFFSFKKESLSPLLSSSRTQISSFLNVDQKNKEQKHPAHIQQGKLKAPRRKDRPINSSVDISSFSFPKRMNETTDDNIEQRAKGKAAELVEAQEDVLVDEANRMGEIGEPFDVRHALHVECDDLAVLPLEWVDALKAQGSTPAEILQLAVSKSKSHMLRQNSINLPIPARPNSPPPPPLPPLPHQPTSPSGRHSRSSSFIPARSWAPLSGDKTENLRSRLAKRMTKSNSLLFGSSLFGGRRDGPDSPMSSSEPAPDASISHTASDVSPIKITSPIVVSRKSCVISSPSLISSPSQSSTSPLSSPQSSLKSFSPHMLMSNVPSMSPRLSLNFDVGSFQVPLSPLGPERSTEKSILGRTNNPLDPPTDLGENSTFLTTSHHVRSPSFLSFSSSISDSNSSASPPPSVHPSTPGQTHPTTANPSAQRFNPSVFHQTDSSNWPQSRYAEVKEISKAASEESESGSSWEEQWDLNKVGEERVSVEIGEKTNSGVIEEQNGHTCLGQSGLFMSGNSFETSQALNQDDTISAQLGRSLSLTPSQSKSKRSSAQTSLSKHSSFSSISSAGSSQEAVISKAVLVRNTFLVSDVTVSNLSSV